MRMIGHRNADFFRSRRHGSAPGQEQASLPGGCPTDMHLLRPPLIGLFQQSFRLHRLGYARETIAEIGSMGAALATVHIGQTGS
jgi:hypothetical protein